MADAGLVGLVTGALKVALTLGLPFALVALVVGVLAGVFQAGTSVQDQSIGTVPRLVAVGALALVLAPWVLRTLAAFAEHVLSDFSGLVG